MEEVVGRLCLRTSLLVSENKIDPVVEILRNIVRLQGLPMYPYELMGRSISPRGKSDIVYQIATLSSTQWILVRIDE